MGDLYKNTIFATKRRQQIVNIITDSDILPSKLQVFSEFENCTIVITEQYIILEVFIL